MHLVILLNMHISHITCAKTHSSRGNEISRQPAYHVTAGGVGGPLILSFPLYFAHNFISFDSFNFHPWFIVYFLWIKLSNYYMLRLVGKKSAQKLNCSHFSISYGNTMSTWWFKLKTFEAFWIYCFCPPSYEFRKFP